MNSDPNQFQNTFDVLKKFSGSESSRDYGDYVRFGLSEYENEKIVKNVRNANRGNENFFKCEPWVLGTSEFVKETLEKDRCRRARIALHLRENITYEIIHEKIESAFELPKNDLYRQGRLNVRATARLLFAYLGKFRFDFSGIGLASYLGVSGSAVSKMISRCKFIQSIDTFIEAILKRIPVEPMYCIRS